MTQEPTWLEPATVQVMHRMVIAAHGGLAGLRDGALLESAVSRPRNRWLYEQAPLADLAASLAFGLARNHAFIDGNKRVAFLAMVVFLERNGRRFTAGEADATVAILAVADGSLSEADLGRWIADHSSVLV